MPFLTLHAYYEGLPTEEVYHFCSLPCRTAFAAVIHPAQGHFLRRQCPATALVPHEVCAECSEPLEAVTPVAS